MASSTDDDLLWGRAPEQQAKLLEACCLAASVRAWLWDAEESQFDNAAEEAARERRRDDAHRLAMWLLAGRTPQIEDLRGVELCLVCGEARSETGCFMQVTLTGALVRGSCHDCPWLPEVLTGSPLMWPATQPGVGSACRDDTLSPATPAQLSLFGEGE